MAMILSLVRTADFEAADIESKSLLSFTDGFSVERGGWAQAVAADDEESVIEAMTLWARGSSHDNLAAILVALDTLLAKARLYKETPEMYGLWLRAQLTNETNARQALVLRTRCGPAQVISPPTSPGNTIKGYLLQLERMPLWEATASVNYSAYEAHGVGGSAYVPFGIGLRVAGTDPARIAHVSLEGKTAVALTEFWCGFRTARYYGLSDFTTPWELESGTAGTDTAVATDATASPGGAGNTKMSCTFTTTSTMATRVTLTPYQVNSATYYGLRGTFDLILRTKCAAGVTARIRLSNGLSGTSSYRYCDPINVTGTTWKMYNIGRVTLPAGGKAPSSYDAMRNSILRIQAELIAGAAGAGALEFDCIAPIPVDEGYFHVAGGSGVKQALLISPTGCVAGFDYTGTTITGILDTSGVDPKMCVLPIGVNLAIFAAQRNAGSTLEDFVVFTIRAIPRYRTLRGAA